MEPSVIRVGEARELLAYVPYRLGFRPSRSLALVSIRAPSNEVGLVVRTDLAALADEAEGERLARSVARHLARDGARRAVVVLYTEEPRRDLRSGLGCGGTALSRMRGALPVDFITEVWVVSRSGYAAVDCDDEECCPEGGRPLRDLESAQLAAEMVVRGARLVDSRDELALNYRAAPVARRAAARAAAAERARQRALVGEAVRSGAADPLEQWAERAMAGWRLLRQSARDGRPLSPAALGRLLVALEDVRIRDEMMLALVVRSEAGRHEGLGAGLDDLFRPGGGLPSSDVVTCARHVLEAVVAHASRRRTAPALSVLAWLAWWEGDGARASVLVQQALAVDPVHRLTRLLEEALQQGLAPGWARPDVLDAERDDGAEERGVATG